MTRIGAMASMAASADIDRAKLSRIVATNVEPSSTARSLQSTSPFMPNTTAPLRMTATPVTVVVCPATKTGPWISKAKSTNAPRPSANEIWAVLNTTLRIGLASSVSASTVANAMTTMAPNGEPISINENANVQLAVTTPSSPNRIQVCDRLSVTTNKMANVANNHQLTCCAPHANSIFATRPTTTSAKNAVPAMYAAMKRSMRRWSAAASAAVVSVWFIVESEGRYQRRSDESDRRRWSRNQYHLRGAPVAAMSAATVVAAAAAR